MQRIIFRQDSKQLNRVNNISVFSGEKDVDFLEFLIPLEYNGVDLSDCNVRMSYVTGNGFEHSFLIDEYKKEELYEDEYFIYLVPVSPRFTSVEGTVNAYLSITKTVDGEEQKILKTGDVEILIRDHLSDSSQLDEEDIEIIDQVVLKAQWAVDEVERIEHIVDDKVDKSTTVAGISLENNIDADDLAGNVLTVYATRSVEDRDFYTKDEVDDALDDKLDKDKLGRGLRINGSNLESTAMMYVTGDVVPENGQFTIPSAISTTARVGDIYYCTTNQRAYLITTVGRYNLAYVEPFNDIVFKNSDPVTESANSDPINKTLKPGVIYVNTSTNNMWMCKTKTYDNPYYHYTWISMNTKQVIESENNPPTDGVIYKIGDEWIKSGSQVFMLVKISGNHPPFDYTWKDLTEQVDLTAGDGIDIDNNVINVGLSNANSILKFTVDNQKRLWADGNAIANDPAFKATMPFIDEIRQHLTSGNNYPLASKQYVDGLMSGALKRLIVDQLPTQDIDTNTIYMVLRSAPTTNNIYDEYLYVKVSDDPETYDWELIGNTEVDLSNYYTKSEVYNKTEVDTLLLAKQDVITEGDYIDINNNIVSVKTGKTYGYKLLSNGIMTQVNVSDNKSFVIDNVKVGSGLPSDHTTGYVEFSYSDTFSDAVTIKNGDIFNIQNKDYIYLRFTRTLGSGSAGVDYSILSRDDYLVTGEDLDVKADKSDTYTKEETNTFLNAKADKDTTYTKTETDSLLDDKEDKITTGDGLKREGNVVSVDNGKYLYFSNGQLTINPTSLGSSKLRQDLADTTITTQYKPLATREYVDNLMSGAVKRLVVESLPTQDIDTNTIYMILKSVPSTNNIYDEYMYINNAWELIGSTEVDLSNYYTKTESDNRYNAKLTVGNGIDITNDTISVKLTTYNNILNFVNGELWASGTAIANDPSFQSEMPSITAIRQGLTTGNNSPLQPKLTAGTNITIDSNNVISASGGGLSYTFTNGLTESSGTVGINLASGSKLLIDSNDKLDVDLSSKQDTIDSTHKLSADLVDDTNSSNKFVSATDKQTWNAKADNTTISTDTTSTTVSLTLADNHEYRYTQDLTSLTLTMPSGDFIASVVFASGSTPTSMTYDSSIKWSGNDVSSNAFVPQANMEYEIVFWYNGLSINAVVRGVA